MEETLGLQSSRTCTSSSLVWSLGFGRCLAGGSLFLLGLGYLDSPSDRWDLSLAVPF